eukprot:gene4647-3349_t
MEGDGDQQNGGATKKYRWEDATAASASAVAGRSTRWGATPRQFGEATPRAGGAAGGSEGGWGSFATPSATPIGAEEVGTPRFGGTYLPVGGATPAYEQTPRAGGLLGATPSQQFVGTTPMQSHYVAGGAGANTLEGPQASTALLEEKAKKIEAEWRLKNKRLTEEFLDSYLPSTEYFEIVPPPAEYARPPAVEPNFYELAGQELARSMEQGGLGPGMPGTYEIPESLGPGMPEMQPHDAVLFSELLQYAGKEDSIPPTALLSYMLMKNLFKIKNGDVSQRRAGSRYLLDKVKLFGPALIFSRLFRIWEEQVDITDLQQKHYLLEFCKALISHLGVEVRASCKEVVHMVEPLLSFQESVIREDGRQTLILLTRVAGFHAVWDVIQPDFSHSENSVRRHTAKVVALIASAVGLEDTMKALEGQSFSYNATARQTTARALGEIASIMRHAIVASMAEMITVLERLIRDERRVAKEAAVAIAMIAEVCAPYGRDELATVVHHVCEECRKGIGSTAAPFIRAFGALLPLMAPEEARSRITAMMPVLVNQFHTPEEEFRRTMLQVVKRCVKTETINGDFIGDVLLEPFFSGFWKVQRLAADRKTSALLLSATVAMARKVGSVPILMKLAADMKDDNEFFQRLVMSGVRRVVSAVGLEEAKTDLCYQLLERTVSAVKQDEDGVNRVAIDTLASICNALGKRLRDFLDLVYGLIRSRGSSHEPKVRTQVAELVTRIARVVVEAGGTPFLLNIGSNLFTRLEDEDDNTFSSNLRATRVLLQALGRDANGVPRYLPSVGELLKKLTHVIKKPVSSVQQNAVMLIETIASEFDAEVEPVHLHQLATRGLFDLLDADRRETRKICARTFGVIASKIGPFSIVLGLVDNFRQDKRKIRICTAVALGAVAKSCGPFTVLPYVLNEFQISDSEQVAVIVQHAVLKAVRYIFESIGPTGQDYVFCTLRLLQRAMTEASLPMRRMAIEASRSMLLAVAGVDGFRDVAIHLLNFAHPNIIELLSKRETKVGEERLKLVSAVVSFYEAARLHVGSGLMYAYLVQGLFHPAKLVRDIYRRAYNLMYLASPEQMVPHYALLNNGTEYPVTEESPEELRHQPMKRFRRYEIEYAVLRRKQPDDILYAELPAYL